jgi:hypothetical protein
MADDKIRISWDDISRPEVDQKVNQQELLARAQQNQARGGAFAPAGQANPYAAPQSQPVSFQSLWYNSLFYMSAFGFAGGLIAWLAMEVAWQTVGEEENIRELVTLFVAMGIVGALISLSLSIADHVVAQNWRSAIINGSVGLALGLFGGVINLCIASLLYNGLGGGDEGTPIAMQVLARGLAWGCMGLFLSIAPGIVLMNGKRFAIGLAGGFLGGLLGGLLFDVIAILTNDTLSRLVGLTAIGLIAGVGTGLIELAAKSGWLKVVGGLIVGKQFVLYKNPTYLGSSPQCEVYLFKDPQVAPQHAALHQMPGGYDLEDLRSHTGTLVNGRAISRVRLRNNDLIQIGGSTLQFQEKQS